MVPPPFEYCILRGRARGDADTAPRQRHLLETAERSSTTSTYRASSSHIARRLRFIMTNKLCSKSLS